MKPLRAGVIGVGHLGQHHARIYASLPSSVLVGVVDVNPARAHLIADRHGARVFTDQTELLKQVDVVSVAVPTSFHYPVVKTCLRAGAHVLVEKPIAVEPVDARDLIRVAHEKKRVLQVGHSERFNPIMVEMRPVIQRPAFIECHRLSVFGDRGTDVDVVLDLMVHDLDLVLSFKPGPVEEVRAAGVAVLSPNIDIANARIQFRNGCVANLTASRVSTTKMRRLRIFQRDSYVSVDFQTRQGMICRRVEKPGERTSVEMESRQGNDAEPLTLQLEAFLQAVTTGSKPVVSGEDGLATLELAHSVLDAIGCFMQRHAAGGAEVKVKVKGMR
jgi:predicted dehydrogenase